MENKIILVVEDNPDDKELIIRAFRKNNIDARLVILHDGVEAMSYLNFDGAYASRSRHEVPCLILLDLKLPKIDGKEVLKMFRQNPAYKYVPIVILSSSGEKRDIHDTYMMGANSYIKKPIDFSHFLDIVDVLNRYWINFNQFPAVS